MNAAQVRPALAGSERESDGRLVGLDFDSTPPLKAPDANPWRLHVAMGEPAERIHEQAVRLRACVIVIGSRGLSVVESLLFGSVAEKVMHLSRLPVMVVP